MCSAIHQSVAGCTWHILAFFASAFHPTYVPFLRLPSGMFFFFSKPRHAAFSSPGSDPVIRSDPIRSRIPAGVFPSSRRATSRREPALSGTPLGDRVSLRHRRCVLWTPDVNHFQVISRGCSWVKCGRMITFGGEHPLLINWG